MNKIIPLVSSIMLFSCLASFAQNYCVPYFTTQDVFLDNFALHTMVNTYSGVNNSGYVLYPDSIFSTNLNLGQHYPISMSSDYPSGPIGKFAAWIDFNNDGIFDPTERIHYDSINYFSTSGMVSIPEDSSFLGSRRLRVIRCHYLFQNQPCGNFYSGEAEDYTVNITANQTDSLTYCIPFHTANLDPFIINDFSINTLVNFNSGSNTTNYELYPETAFTTDLHLGCTYPVYLAKFDWFVGVTGGFSLWIDLNNDGLLSETERLFYSADTIGMATGFVTIPDSSAYIGKHRLRVRGTWGWAVTDPCRLVAGGETEDYTITISPIPAYVSSFHVPLNNVVIYPDPAHDWFFVYCHELSLEGMGLKIFNSLRQEIIIKEQLFIDKNKIAVNLSGLPDGIYLVNCKIKQFEKWFKLVKN